MCRNKTKEKLRIFKWKYKKLNFESNMFKSRFGTTKARLIKKKLIRM